ncbi:MAG: DedA family protein [Candidatus Fimimorpha sp.]
MAARKRGNVLQTWIVQIMEKFGYVGMAILILVENIFPPIPSELILTFGGFMTTHTNMTIIGVVVSATIGSVLGAIMLYYIGLLLPRERLEMIVDGKVGQVLRLNKQDIQKAMDWFDRKGKLTVFFCRCIPIVRSLISIPAGMAEMKFADFFILTTLGSLVWNTILVSAGAWAGSSWMKIIQIMNRYSEITYGVLLIIGFLLILRWKNRTKKKLLSSEKE